MYTKEDLEEKRPKELVQIILDLQKMVRTLESNQLSEELVTEIIRITSDDSIRPMKKIKFIFQLLDY